MFHPIRLITLFFLLFSATSFAQLPVNYVPGEIVVKFKDKPQPLPARPDRSETLFPQILSSLVQNFPDHKGLTYREFKTSSQFAVFQVPPSIHSNALQILKKDDRVEIAEPNFRIAVSERGSGTVPNDTYFPEQWAVHNVGQNDENGIPGLAGADIHVEGLWAMGVTGSKSIRVAVIDTGADFSHPDLQANLDSASGYDFVNGRPLANDDNGHGTHCAGTIGALGNNGAGIAGINWAVTVIPIKTFDEKGGGTLDRAAQGVQLATKLGVKVISASWGAADHSQILLDAIKEAEKKGILMVVAAGNDHADLDDPKNAVYPVNYGLENVLSVAATDNQDKLAAFSNFGAKSVQVAAPGVSIASTVPGAQYRYLSGTSMAAPQVAGIAALLLSVNPSLTYPKLKEILIRSCDQVPALTNKVSCGGRVNATNAFKALKQLGIQ